MYNYLKEMVHILTVLITNIFFSFYKGQLEEVISHQSSLDQVSQKAQALLQTNADAKTSHAITQLNTRYQAIIALAKVRSFLSHRNIFFFKKADDIKKKIFRGITVGYLIFNTKNVLYLSHYRKLLKAFPP